MTDGRPGARYRRSRELLDRALRSIPLGTQTFSKSTTQFPAGVSPHFVERASGSRVVDVDGNEYVDWINAQLSILLGHADPGVDAAVRAQLERGTTFSLAHPLEVEVAERIVRMVPCAEQVRFGKNGSDATAAAVRLARAETGRDHVAVCGYHGWQDWYIGSTTRNLGVPRVVSDRTHPFAYNDLADLDRVLATRPGEFAAVVLEPMSVVEPEPGFLAGVRERTHAHGALLVFDEIITGFRFANGGAQERFGVTPDLATLGKGLANGLPLSAVVGPERRMRRFEEIFFSVTFGGETLSLAAAGAVLERLEREPVTARLERTGRRLLDLLDACIERHAIGDVFVTAGHPTWSFLLPGPAAADDPWPLKTWLMQELLARGMLWYGSHNVSAAHDDGDVDRLLAAYDDVLPEAARLQRDGTLERALEGEVLRPLFSIR